MTPGNSSSAAATSATLCANCLTPNGSDARFCSGCGQTLFQPCPDCDNQIRIGAGFCNHCGSNISDWIQKQRDELLQSLVRARDYGKAHDYDEAIYLASAVTQNSDFRFNDIVEKAGTMLEKLKSRKDRYVARLQQVVPAAKEAFQQGRTGDMVQLLESVPLTMLDEESKALLSGAKQNAATEADLAREIRDAVDAKDYAKAGMLLNQILQIQPENTTYSRLAMKIGNALMNSGMKYYERGEYVKTVDKLDCVPQVAQDENYTKIRASLEELFWLRNHVHSYPFATVTLAKLCEKLTALTPQDAIAGQLHQKIVERRQSSDADPRGFFARLTHFESEFWQCQPDYLARLQSLDCSACEATQKQPVRFAPAIGAALQGIGQGQLNFRFGGRDERKGIQGLLKRRKGEAVAAWGLDIGPSSVRALRLELEPGSENPIITAAELAPMEIPTCRPNQAEGTDAVREVLEQLVEKYPLRDEPVWTLISGRQALGRCIELPPTEAKQLNQLAEAEIEHQFPVPKDQLVAQHWFAAKEDAGDPQYTALIGIRSSIVEQLVHLLSEVGIEPAGIQVEPAALANLVYREFASELVRTDASLAPPAIAVLDVGIEASNLVVCTADKFWFRSLDLGGDSFSEAIAKSQRVTMVQADQIKQSLATRPRVAPLFEVLEERYGAYNVRLKQLFAGCKKDLGSFSLKGIWCTGGGCLVHGFIHRVFSDDT